MDENVNLPGKNNQITSEIKTVIPSWGEEPEIEASVHHGPPDEAIEHAAMSMVDASSLTDEWGNHGKTGALLGMEKPPSLTEEGTDTVLHIDNMEPDSHPVQAPETRDWLNKWREYEKKLYPSVPKEGSMTEASEETPGAVKVADQQLEAEGEKNDVLHNGGDGKDRVMHIGNMPLDSRQELPSEKVDNSREYYEKKSQQPSSGDSAKTGDGVDTLIDNGGYKFDTEEWFSPRDSRNTHLGEAAKRLTFLAGKSPEDKSFLADLENEEMEAIRDAEKAAGAPLDPITTLNVGEMTPEEKVVQEIADVATSNQAAIDAPKAPEADPVNSEAETKIPVPDTPVAGELNALQEEITKQLTGAPAEVPHLTHEAPVVPQVPVEPVNSAPVAPVVPEVAVAVPPTTIPDLQGGAPAVDQATTAAALNTSLPETSADVTALPPKGEGWGSKIRKFIVGS